MDQIRKKLRETAFFLRKMSERAQKAFGEHEEFDFYLSAFLSAPRSIDYRFRHEQEGRYSSFRNTWDNSLPPSDQRILKFLVDDRNLEVHESGSARNQRESRIPVFDSYQDKSGRLTVCAPVGSSPSAEIIKPSYSFTIDGIEVPVLECCQKYVELLKGLLVDYCRSQGIPPS